MTLISKDKIREAHKHVTHNPATSTVLSEPERRVLKLIGVRDLSKNEKREILRESLNKAWSLKK